MALEWLRFNNPFYLSDIYSAMLNMASSQHKNHLLMVPNSHLLVSLLKVVYPHESSIVNLPSLQSIQNTDPCSDPLIHESDPDAESDSNNVTSLNVGEQLENDTILGSFAQPNAASLHFQPSERPPSMGQCTPITSGFTTTTEGKWERPYVLAEVSTPRSSLKPFVAQFDKHSPQPDQSSDYDSKTEEDASFRQSVTELDEYEHIVEGAHNTDVQYFTVHSTAMEESEYQSYESDSAYTSEAVD